jgi:hypothetical protein
MPKYYIQSGSKHLITTADNPENAAIKTAHYFLKDIDNLSKFHVDEKGFKTVNAAVTFKKSEILEKGGITQIPPEPEDQELEDINTNTDDDPDSEDDADSDDFGGVVCEV